MLFDANFVKIDWYTISLLTMEETEFDLKKQAESLVKELQTLKSPTLEYYLTNKSSVCLEEFICNCASIIKNKSEDECIDIIEGVLRILVKASYNKSNYPLTFTIYTVGIIGTQKEYFKLLETISKIRYGSSPTILSCQNYLLESLSQYIDTELNQNILQSIKNILLEWLNISSQDFHNGELKLAQLTEQFDKMIPHWHKLK